MLKTFLLPFLLGTFLLDCLQLSNYSRNLKKQTFLMLVALHPYSYSKSKIYNFIITCNLLGLSYSLYKMRLYVYSGKKKAVNEKLSFCVKHEMFAVEYMVSEDVKDIPKISVRASMA